MANKLVFFGGIFTAKPYVSVTENKTLMQLIKIENQLEKLYARPDPNVPDDETKFLTIMSDLADRELVITISWAKQVPGMNLGQLIISLYTQSRLLQPVKGSF